MKKIFTLVCLLFTVLFFTSVDVKAFSYPLNPECEKIAKNGREATKCKLQFSTTTTRYLDEFKIRFTLTSATMDVTESIISEGYKATYDKANNIINIKTIKNAFPMGTYTIGEYYFYKIDSGNQCYVTYSINPGFIVRTCKHDEENGIYYDKNGDITDQLTYQKQCEENICKTLSDGTYFGKNGNEVTKDVYESECLDKKYCAIDGDKYYGKDGNEVSKTEYQKQCERNYCKIIDNTYFGKNGNEVTKDVYENECLERYICTKNNDKYYGKDGKEISEIEYQKQCLKNVCTVLSDGTYYDKDGNVTDESTYKKQCEKHKCEIIDNTYFDDKGNIVDEQTYNNACKNICKVVDNKYYDRNGNEVDKQTYITSCGLDNPDTGNALPLIYCIVGTAIAGILFYISKKNKKIINQ